MASKTQTDMFLNVIGFILITCGTIAFVSATGFFLFLMWKAVSSL